MTRSGPYGAAYDDMGGTGAEDVGHALRRLDAAAELDAERGVGGNALKDRQVARRTGFGAVEVDEVQAGDSGIPEGGGDGEGVGAVAGHLAVVAAAEAHALAVDEVDGGNDLNHSSEKFLRRRRPTALLFSGWNCTP